MTPVAARTSGRKRVAVGAGKSRLTKCTVQPGLLNTRGP